MKRRLSLAQQLTASIAIAVLIQTAFVFSIFWGYFEPRLEQAMHQVVQRGATSDAQLYASRWNYEVMVAANMLVPGDLDKDLQGKIKQLLKNKTDVSGLAIFKVNQSSSAKFNSLKKQTQILAKDSSGKINFDVGFVGLKSFKEHSNLIVGDNVYAGVPVMVEQDIIGYLVFVRSIQKFHRDVRNFKWGMVVVIAIFFILQLGAIFWIGSRAGKPLKRLAKTASQIAGGDLTQKATADTTSAAETASLSKAIDDMAQAIHEQVSLIKTLTLQASGSSKGVAKAMSQLASSASEQAAAVSQTAITVEEMEKSGKHVAAAVKRIVDAAVRSAEASTRGREAVDTASGIIVKIKADSANISVHSRTLLTHVEEVGNIINSVNAISEQSKILAVNASIEAAKAGEYGSGFAVVAQEVKNLAGQSKDATEQITRTLTSIRQSVEGMVRLARDGEERTALGVSSISNTGAIVNDLSDAIQEASEVADEIDSSVSQQSMGLSQIASAMDEINISASENQQISKKMESSTLEMTRSLDELSVLVDVWTTIDLVEKSNE